MANSASSPFIRVKGVAAASAKGFTGLIRANLGLLLLPALLVAGYLLQRLVPAVAAGGMLASADPVWWQYFSYSFLSANPAHLAFGSLALFVVVSEFARGIRPLVLLLLFVGLAALAALCYHHWLMPRNSMLVGASGGTYALLGFCGGWRPRDRIGLPRIPFGIPIPAGVAVVVAAEATIAHFWLPTLGWPLHAIGFALGTLTGWTTLGVSLLGQRLGGICFLKRGEKQDGVFSFMFHFLRGLERDRRASGCLNFRDLVVGVGGGSSSPPTLTHTLTQKSFPVQTPFLSEMPASIPMRGVNS